MFHTFFQHPSHIFMSTMLKVVSSIILNKLQKHTLDWMLHTCLVVSTLYLPIHNTQTIWIILFVRHLLTYLLTYSMVQSSSWEDNWFAASQEIPRISRNPKVHSQASATYFYPGPAQSSPYTHILLPGDPS